MKKYNDIGDLFRDNFKDYAPVPSSHVWENISQKVVKPHSSYFKFKYVYIGATIFIATTAITLSIVLQQTKTTHHVTSINSLNSTEQTIHINKDKIIQDHITTLGKTTGNKTLIKNTTSKKIDSTENQSTTTPLVEKTIPPQLHIQTITQTSNTEKEQKEIKMLHKTGQKENFEQTNPEYTSNKELSVRNTDKAIYISKDTTVCENAIITLYAKNAKNIMWNNGQTDEEIREIINQSKTFTVNYTDAYGKDTTAHIFVRAVPCTILTIPTAFTPNNDGLNDEFRIFASGTFSEFEIIIYSTHKKILFQTSHIEQGWDGTHNGNILPHGVYLYRVRYKDNFNQTIERKGEFLLIR